MSKIDIDKFIASILGNTESDFFSLDSDDVRNALADQHLEYKDGQIKPVEKSQSEDEKLRKELTEFLKSASGGFLNTTIQCKTFGKWLAWVEKQGDKNQRFNSIIQISDGCHAYIKDRKVYIEDYTK